MKAKTLVMAVGLAVAALGSVGVANATPMLQIVDGTGSLVTPPPGPPFTPPYPGNAEAIGDPGGTNYANGPTAGATAGPGMPTALGGWPASANFAADGSFGGALGISGYDGSYLNLTEAANVTFQFMGKGDAADHNQFQVNTGSGWTTIWDNQSGSNGTCGVSGTTPTCTFPLSQQTFYFGAGLIAFQFVNLTTPATATNDGLNNPKDIAPGYFLGMDPYLASGAFLNEGTSAYAGFTDRPPPGDHDYEDLIVRASVPEPGTLFLLGIGMLGVASSLRRRKV